MGLTLVILADPSDSSRGVPRSEQRDTMKRGNRSNNRKSNWHHTPRSLIIGPVPFNLVLSRPPNEACKSPQKNLGDRCKPRDCLTFTPKRASPICLPCPTAVRVGQIQSRQKAIVFQQSKCPDWGGSSFRAITFRLGRVSEPFGRPGTGVLPAGMPKRRGSRAPTTPGHSSQNSLGPDRGLSAAAGPAFAGLFPRDSSRRVTCARSCSAS